MKIFISFSCLKKMKKLGELRNFLFILKNWAKPKNYLSFNLIINNFMFNISDNRKIGMFLVLAGVTSYTMGVLLFFDRSLLMIGNLSFLTGIVSLIGVKGTIVFFTKKEKIKASGYYFGGFLIIILKFSFIGSLIQIWGLFCLFFSFFPYLFDWMLTLPGIGTFLSKITRI